MRAFSNAAHDVNNDLQVIGGSAELLERRDLEPAVRRRVQAIREQAAAAAATINRLLAYSRAEPGTPGPIDVSQVVSAAVAMRRASLSRARIAIDVASVPEPCWAVADGGRTLQALLDVLLAAEAMARHRPNARVLLRVEPDGDAIALHVIDGGRRQCRTRERRRRGTCDAVDDWRAALGRRPAGAIAGRWPQPRDRWRGADVDAAHPRVSAPDVAERLCGGAVGRCREPLQLVDERRAAQVAAAAPPGACCRRSSRGSAGSARVRAATRPT